MPQLGVLADEEKKIIRIDPGMAFGIGSHESTRLCIELMEKHLGAGWEEKGCWILVLVPGSWL